MCAKKFEKDLVFQKSCHIFALAFALKTAVSIKRRFLKIFLKKVAKIFGIFKNSVYLCTTFRSKKRVVVKQKMVL